MPGKAVTDRISGFATTENVAITDPIEQVNATRNFATTPERFSFGPPEGEVWEITRVVFYIGDAGGASPTEYGNLGAALSNGYNLDVRDAEDNLLVRLNDRLPFTTNGGIARVCYDVYNLGTGVGGDDAITGRWTFAKDGYPLRLVGRDGHKVCMDLSDNLTALTDHNWLFDGRKAT